MNRIYRKTGLVAVLVMALIMSSACAQALSIAGSTTVQPIADQCAINYTACCAPGAAITVAGGGSSYGIAAVSNGSVDIGMSSRDPTTAEITGPEPDLVTRAIAEDAVDAIIDSDNPHNINSLTTAELCGIYCTGTITNWNQVGGNNAPIVVYNRAVGSGTRATFEAGIGCTITVTGTVVASNSAMHAAVAADPNGIGYISHGYDDAQVKDVNRVSTRTLWMITKGAPDAGYEEGYLAFVSDRCGQQIVDANNFTPMPAPVNGDTDGDGDKDWNDVVYRIKVYMGTAIYPGYCICNDCGTVCYP